MSFWVYENWTADNKAVIHRGDCSFCNNGAGVHKVKTDGRNGRWHGPFTTCNAALKAAQNLKRAVRKCKFCAPS
jgi:hypothetical protein